MANYHQGTYTPVNEDKYIGTRKPEFRSSWELEVFRFMDLNPKVIKWGSEVVQIPYYSQADGKMRRYFVDLYVEFLDRHGNIHTEIVEIKPYIQTQPPKATRGKRKKTLLQEQYTYQVNTDKWAAAVEYAKKRGWRFRILTEKNIFR